MTPARAPDHYETLQVHPRADAEAIRAAYERLIARYDPEQLAGVAEDLRELAAQRRAAIEAAHQVLSDPQRRAAYDGERAEAPAEAPAPAAPGSEQQPDFRPLPPAGGRERERRFAHEPLVSAPPQRVSLPVALSILVGALAVVLAVSVLITNWSSIAAPAPAAVAEAPTASPLDQYEEAVAQAKQLVEQTPNDPQAWVLLGNHLYDSVQIVRENMPDSTLYQQRLPRWLEASQAYARALELDPSNAAVRADRGASLCFYGAGAGEQGFVREGTAEVEAAAAARPDDPLIQLNLGNCLVSAIPPQTDAAIRAWERVLQTAPADSPLAARARELIEGQRTSP